MYLLLLVLFKFYFVAALNPVVLMPGLIGSQLQTKLNKPTSDHGCKKKEDWSSLWFNGYRFLNQNCFYEDFKLEINENSGTTRNREGVEIRCPRFGDTFAVEYLGPTIYPFTKDKLMYFGDFVDKLVCLEYKRNHSVRGAPYDFRKAPNEMAEYFDSLTDLIEKTYEINNRKRVIMIGHSMGCLYTLYFLNHKDQAWKDKYVEAFIALGAPWHGSVLALKVVASGDNFGMPFFEKRLASKFRDAARTMPSGAWLMPSDVAWKSDEILVMGKQRNYTVNDYEEFFNDIKFENGMLLRRNTENVTKSLEYPGVKIYCIYGFIPNSTPESFDYRRSKSEPWYDEMPYVINGAGDGIVNFRNLEACKDWPNTTVKVFENADHKSMMRNKVIQDYILKILYELYDI